MGAPDKLTKTAVPIARTSTYFTCTRHIGIWTSGNFLTNFSHSRTKIAWLTASMKFTTAIPIRLVSSAFSRVHNGFFSLCSENVATEREDHALDRIPDGNPQCKSIRVAT